MHLAIQKLPGSCHLKMKLKSQTLRQSSALLSQPVQFPASNFTDCSLRKQPLFPSRDISRDVVSGEERGETAALALHKNCMYVHRLHFQAFSLLLVEELFSRLSKFNNPIHICFARRVVYFIKPRLGGLAVINT